MKEEENKLFQRVRNFGGYNIYYTLEEELLIDKIDLNGGIISLKELNIEELILCKYMVQKGMLNRIKDNRTTYYMINKRG